MSRSIPEGPPAVPGARTPLVFVCLGLVLAACEKPAPPRSFVEFMDDPVARDGIIAYCNERPQEAASNIECANARRAQATMALRAERERRAALERESERKLEAMRIEMVERERIVRETALAAAQSEREAYEEMWGPQSGPVIGAGGVLSPAESQPEPGRDSGR
jgi:hypothetical protein